MAPSIFRHLDGLMTRSHSIIVLASNQVVLPNEVHPATIVICRASGRIAAIYRTIVPQTYFPKDATYINYHDLILMPGLVDTHVHLNEPGRTSSEGFYTGTQAAASGGITTVVDMPLNSIPATTSLEALDTKIQAAQGKCWVDVGFLGGIIPGNTAEMKPMISAGVRGFKGFLIDSGVCFSPSLDLLIHSYSQNETGARIPSSLPNRHHKSNGRDLFRTYHAHVPRRDASHFEKRRNIERERVGLSIPLSNACARSELYLLRVPTQSAAEL